MSKAPLSLKPHIDCVLPHSAMVMAAGLGKRMRPLTATRPKPLIEVAGKSLLDRALDGVAAAGIDHAVVNAHYFADQIEATVRARKAPARIDVSDERGLLLETGGGITKALPLLKGEAFYTINADNMWIDGPVDTLRLLAQRWDATQMDALLLLVPLARAHGYEGRGDFHMDGLGRLTPRAGLKVAPFVYSGVQIISRALFDGEPVEPFTMWRAWNKALESGRMFGISHPGLWFHVGTPASIGETEALLQEV
ncbi:nucleotidyltransferase family protein [Sandarakinorhabdus sp. AAP62]|uniref:nucleotidyltransferase family protein n=1 Tax=Sandarakinorhabdus sp. AAP62 TaxID=1248916 RepID=UPI00031E1F51|nr:nucleotidyltransferase family protein [Sandarakinorhabdus sp. AAP62]